VRPDATDHDLQQRRVRLDRHQLAVETPGVIDGLVWPISLIIHFRSMLAKRRSEANVRDRARNWSSAF
jgi:hypothetical protein